MIDIHSHLLFGVDDGSRTLEESVHVIKKLSEVGYTDIILTPHYINDSTYVSTREENLDVLKRLKVGLIRNNVNVNLYLGNEIYIDSEIANLLKNNINIDELESECDAYVKLFSDRFVFFMAQPLYKKAKEVLEDADIEDKGIIDITADSIKEIIKNYGRKKYKSGI